MLASQHWPAHTFSAASCLQLIPLYGSEIFLFLFFFFRFKIVFCLSFSNSDCFSSLSQSSPPLKEAIITSICRGDWELLKDQCKPGTPAVVSLPEGLIAWNHSGCGLLQPILHGCTMHSVKLACPAPFPHQCSPSLPAVFA